jgi:D-sedoheptulose 7-phosphate isomerase
MLEKRSKDEILAEFFENHPKLKCIEPDLLKAYDMMLESFANGNKLLVCGNGGSTADCDHIIVELLKSSELRRPITDAQRKTIEELYPVEGKKIADQLMQGLPAISLVAHATMLTGMVNDVSIEMMFAQQVFAYGKPGDMLLAISTSGKSENVLNAVRVAKSLRMHTIALTGSIHPDLKDLCEVSICSPETLPPNIQETHLPIYHVLTRLIENYFFE